MHVCLAFLSARFCVCVCASVRAFLKSVFSFFRVSVCVGLTCVCVHVHVHQRCARTPVARAGTGGIYSSAATVGRPRVRFALVIGRFARVGRRCELDEPHDQRAMVQCKSGWAAWPIWAHVGGRRRRHLRHRRPRRHLLPGRVGEHRRRCAAGLAPGVVGGYRVGTTG
jgi:hypothetical protein